MKSKRQKALRTKNRLVLIISLSTLALILIGVVAYQWVSNKKDMATNTSNTEMAVGEWISNNIFKTRKPVDTTSEENSNEDTEISINEEITYTIPSTFIVNTDYPSDQVSFTSPDFMLDTVGMGVAKGLEIHISGTLITDTRTLETEKEDLGQIKGFSKTTNTTIDSVNTLKYHFDGEGVHSLQYYVIKDNYSLTIVIYSKDLNAEKSYQNQINSIISSIQFK